MRFSATLAALALPVLAAAQYGPAPGPAGPATTASATSSAPAVPTAPPSTSTQMNIEVAFNETFVFNPSNITAPNGTTVTFFFPAAGLSHSVTQSSFAAPCTYLAANTTANTTGGFDSGLQQGVQFSINITNDQKPIWFHCKQVGHCGMGMVGSINAPASGNNTFTAFKAAAVAIGSSEVTETDNGPVTGGVNAVATASPSNTATGAASSGSSGSSAGGSHSSATRVVASASAGLLAAALSLVFFA